MELSCRVANKIVANPVTIAIPYSFRNKTYIYICVNQNCIYSNIRNISGSG